MISELFDRMSLWELPLSDCTSTVTLKGAYKGYSVMLQLYKYYDQESKGERGTVEAAGGAARRTGAAAEAASRHSRKDRGRRTVDKCQDDTKKYKQMLVRSRACAPQGGHMPPG